ncbi:MAG: RNA polymerase sigma factor [Spirochaetales bacterium]|nr:RNA polymerase sigma factor [Spirochaetales bacterium]
MSKKIQRLLQNEEERLYRLFLYKTNDPHESWDLLQDLYESVLASLDSFALVENQTAWLVRAAQNKLTDWYRKRSRKKELSADQGREGESSLWELLADADALEDRFFRDALFEALSEAIEALPEKLRAVIKEQALGERTFRELSEEWGVPLGTLLSRKEKAVRLLREALDDFTDVWSETNNKTGGY